MGMKVFSNTIDVAVVGLTNSGKSTFITSLFNESKIPENVRISELRNNNGGLTKVTTYYNIIDCQSVEVAHVDFNFNNILRGIDDTDIESINKKLLSDDYKKFKIDPVVANESGKYIDSLVSNLNKFASEIKRDFETTIKYINMKSADSLIKSIKINVPASDKILEIMKKYQFTSVILRDTRGFLDTDLSDIQSKVPTLADSGLDGIQACIFMNGQDSVMPNLGRDIYGEFVKSIFESVPTFIVERSAKLAGKLEDYLDDNVQLNHETYEGLVNNKRITNLNFNEMQKFLTVLGVTDDKGMSANQLIDAHKRELLLPEISMLKGNTESDDYQIYEFCVFEVFDRLLKTLSDFRTLLNKIIKFFDNPNQLNAIHDKFFSVFYKNYFGEIVKGYYKYYSHAGQLVRPVTQGYSKQNLLYNLSHNRLLGPRGGITTKSSGEYMYGATGVFAATSWNVFQLIIVNLKEYSEIREEIKKFMDDEGPKVLELYILEIQQCLRYILHDKYTDRHAHFGGYPIIDRDKVVSAIINMRNLWIDEYSKKFGEDSIDNVYLISIKECLENLERKTPQIKLTTGDYIRYSQLYRIFVNIIQSFFETVSDSRIINNEIQSLSR